MVRLVISRNGQTIGHHDLTEERTSIGRGADNAVRLDDRAVSSHHAVLWLKAGKAWVEDLDSTNGTRLNGRKIRSDALRHGDVLHIAGFRLRFEDDKAAPSDNLEQTLVLRPGRRAEGALPSLQSVQRRVSRAGPDNPAPKPDKVVANAYLRVLNGPQAGEELRLTKALTTIGRPGIQVAAISRRADGYTLVYVPTSGDRGQSPHVNGKAIGEQGYHLRDNDVIELAGINLGFFLVPEAE